ncbi:MAG: M48 family metallopeptidase [Leptospirales bacterium]|jgi:predicted Zn-dependent protease
MSRGVTQIAGMFRGRFKWIGVLLILCYAGFFYISNRQSVPLTGRSQIVDLSREEETALGVQSYREILSESEVVQSGPAVEQIRRIGRRLAKVSEDPGFRWEFNLIRSNQANAFALPGGKVAIFSGILPVAANEDGLAVIMGHEIAHAIARHGAERMAHQELTQMAGVAADLGMSDMSLTQRRTVMGVLGAGARYGIMLPFSRDHESEADYMGLIFVARACYDPREAPKVWERMGKLSGGGTPSEFMSTHPSSATRIRQFHQWMDEALRIRDEHCGG